MVFTFKQTIQRLHLVFSKKPALKSTRISNWKVSVECKPSDLLLMYSTKEDFLRKTEIFRNAFVGPFDRFCCILRMDKSFIPIKRNIDCNTEVYRIGKVFFAKIFLAFRKIRTNSHVFPLAAGLKCVP